MSEENKTYSSEEVQELLKANDAKNKKLVDQIGDAKVGTQNDLLKSKTEIEELKELLKSQEDLWKAKEESLLLKARQQLKEEQLEKDTTELVKGMSFVDPENVTSLVKAMTTVNKDLGGVILKCFTDMEDIMKAKDREVEEMRESFAPQQSIEGSPTVVKSHFAKSGAEQRNQELNEIVKAKLAEKAKK